ncbi:MAG: carbamate kinase, partial [Dehalococcoidales bacterium]
VACGGGGIPIIEENGNAVGVEAVIDKDLAGQRLATLIGANIFIVLTDVNGAYVNYGKPNQRSVRRMTVQKCRKFLEQGQFPSGSMGPKIESAIKFLESGGKRAIISSLEKAEEALAGKAGTTIVP